MAATETKPTKTCSIDGCDNVHLARGWCRKHYERWRNTGNPLTTIHQSKFEGKFWARVAVREDGCWEWTGALNAEGYGHVGRDGGVRRTHRVAYELLVGPIPEGLHLDHLCRNRRCCNPAHLEPVTNAENVRRAAAAKTHCKWGHPYTAENVYVRPNGRRYCNACAPTDAVTATPAASSGSDESGRRADGLRAGSVLQGRAAAHRRL